MTVDKQWLMGFIEGSGCFSIIIRKSHTQVGYQTVPDFTLKLPRSQKPLLQEIHAFLNIGHVYENKKESILKATKLADALQLVSFLSEPFVSEAKNREFQAWKQCVVMMSEGRQHTKEGMLEIARLRDAVHQKPLWNKKSYCSLRLEVDPCHVYQQTHELPSGCRICWSPTHLVQLPAKEVA